MFDRVVLALLALWALLFGLFNATNIRFDGQQTVMGWSALALGVVCIVAVIVGLMRKK